MLKRNKILWKKERNYCIIKTWTLHKMKVFIKKKEKVYEFLDKGKIDIMEVWE